MRRSRRTVFKKRKPGKEGSNPQSTKASRTSKSSADSIKMLHSALGNQGVQRLFESKAVQATLKINKSDDTYEKEDDMVANQVIRKKKPRVQKPSEMTEEEEVNRKTTDEEEIQESLQTKKTNSPKTSTDSNPQSCIRSLKGGGKTLSKSTRDYMEQRFDHDFSDVRVHTDEKSAKTAKSVNAKAFTTGTNIVFGKGEYSPESITGKRLLAHELTHVVQQKPGRPGAYIQRKPKALKKQDKKVATLLASAIGFLRASQKHIKIQGVKELADKSNKILDLFSLPQNFGLIGRNGRHIKTSKKARLESIFKPKGYMSRVFVFDLTIYLSKEPTEAAAGRYTPMGDWGGKIRLFSEHLANRSTDQISKLIAHEIFHMWSHIQEIISNKYGSDFAALVPTKEASKLLNNKSFSTYRNKMESHFKNLIFFLNTRQRQLGSLVHRSPPEIATNWSDLVVEEVGANLYADCIADAVATEQSKLAAKKAGPGKGGVSFYQRSDPVTFLRNYIRNHWLSNTTDRTILDSQEGKRHLNRMRDDITKLRNAIKAQMYAKK